MNKFILVSKVSTLILGAVALLVMLSVLIGLTCDMLVSMPPLWHAIGLDAIGLLAAVYIVDWISK